MTDLNDIAVAYRQHEQLLRQANALNKAAVFDALADAAISTVTVTFDGEGDSGQIEDLAAFKSGTEEAQTLPEISIQIQCAGWNSGKLDSETRPLRDAIERLCYDYLELTQGGWENNDGAFGEFRFDVETRGVELEFNARFSDSTLFCHTF